MSIFQDLVISGTGLSGSVETAFTLTLPDIQTSPVLFFDSPLTAGPNQSLLYEPTPTLTSSVLLQAGTPYSFIAALDAEASGASAPEPASLALLATAAAGIGAILRRRARLTT